MSQPSDITKFLDDLRIRQKELIREIRMKDDELNSVEKQIELTEQVLAAYCERYKIPQPAVSIDPILQQKFSGMSIRQALVVLAKENNGYLYFEDARKTLVKAGMFKDDRNAATSMSPILSRRGDLFKRLRRGVYELSSTAASKLDSESGRELDLAKLSALQFWLKSDEKRQPLNFFKDIDVEESHKDVDTLKRFEEIFGDKMSAKQGPTLPSQSKPKIMGESWEEHIGARPKPKTLEQMLEDGEI